MGRGADSRDQLATLSTENYNTKAYKQHPKPDTTQPSPPHSPSSTNLGISFFQQVLSNLTAKPPQRHFSSPKMRALLDAAAPHKTIDTEPDNNDTAHPPSPHTRSLSPSTSSNCAAASSQNPPRRSGSKQLSWSDGQLTRAPTATADAADADGASEAAAAAADAALRTQKLEDGSGARRRSATNSPEAIHSTCDELAAVSIALPASKGDVGAEGDSSDDQWGARVAALQTCSECSDSISGPIFMLNDRAYCCQRHRLLAYHKLERERMAYRTLQLYDSDSPSPTGLRASYSMWM